MGKANHVSKHRAQSFTKKKSGRNLCVKNENRSSERFLGGQTKLLNDFSSVGICLNNENYSVVVPQTNRLAISAPSLVDFKAQQSHTQNGLLVL